MVKNTPANAGDTGDVGSIPGSERSPEGGNRNLPSILSWKIPEEPGRATVHGATRSWTQLSD